MSSVVISGNTSGSITLSAPDVSGSNTATLPAATGTVMVSGNMPAFSAYQSSAQTPSSGTWTKVQLQTKEFDTNNNFDSATNYRFTPTVAGYYQIQGCVGVGGAVGMYASIYKNGTQYKTGASSNTSFLSSAVSLVYFNGSTDYVELYVYMGAAQATSATISSTYFNGVLVRNA
jgi:hypothetical protein